MVWSLDSSSALLVDVDVASWDCIPWMEGGEELEVGGGCVAYIVALMLLSGGLLGTGGGGCTVEVCSLVGMVVFVSKLASVGGVVVS